LVLALLPICLFGVEPGQSLYNQGRVEGRELMAMLRGSATETPARLVPCASCHGLRGEGTTEAGVQVPALKSSFSDSELSRAVIDGIGKDGRMLHPSMPSFPLTDQELSGLAAYLRTLTDSDYRAPGLDGKTINIGIALGSRSELAKAVKQAVEAEFREINQRSGIYGRQLHLTPAHSNQDLAKNVFAIVATLDQAGAPAGVPSVGPVSSAAANPSTYTLVASVTDQIAALGEYLSTQQLRRIHWVRAKSPFDVEAESAWVDLTKRHIVESSETKAGADALLFTGSVTDLERLLREVPNVPVATLHLIAGSKVFDWPAQDRRRLVVAYPALLPSQIGPAALGLGDTPMPFLVSRAVGTAAAKVVIEALKRAGRDLTREGFQQALESLHEFRTDLVPLVTFGSRRHAGVRGAYMVSAETNGYARLTDWVNVED